MCEHVHTQRHCRTYVQAHSSERTATTMTMIETYTLRPGVRTERIDDWATALATTTTTVSTMRVTILSEIAFERRHDAHMFVGAKCLHIGDAVPFVDRRTCVEYIAHNVRLLSQSIVAYTVVVVSCWPSCSLMHYEPNTKTLLARAAERICRTFDSFLLRYSSPNCDWPCAFCGQSVCVICWVRCAYC